MKDLLANSLTPSTKPSQAKYTTSPSAINHLVRQIFFKLFIYLFTSVNFKSLIVRLYFYILKILFNSDSIYYSIKNVIFYT